MGWAFGGTFFGDPPPPHTHTMPKNFGLHLQRGEPCRLTRKRWFLQEGVLSSKGSIPEKVTFVDLGEVMRGFGAFSIDLTLIGLRAPVMSSESTNHPRGNHRRY